MIDKKLTEFERLLQESEFDITKIEQEKHGLNVDIDAQNDIFEDVKISLENLNEKNQKAVYKINGLQNKKFSELKKLKDKSLPHSIIDLHTQPSTIDGLKALNNFFKNKSDEAAAFEMKKCVCCGYFSFQFYTDSDIIFFN